MDAVSQITDIVLSGSFTVNVSTSLHNKLIARIQNAIREPDCCNKNQWSVLMRKVLKRNLNYMNHGLFPEVRVFPKID